MSHSDASSCWTRAAPRRERTRWAWNSAASARRSARYESPAAVDQLRLRAQHAPERLGAVGRGEAFAERREVDALDELAVRRVRIAGALQRGREVEVELADEVHVARADRAADAAAQRGDRTIDVAFGERDRRTRAIDHRDEQRGARPVARLGEDAASERGLAARAQDVGEPNRERDELMLRAVLDVAGLHGLANRDERAIEELTGAVSSSCSAA